MDGKKSGGRRARTKGREKQISIFNYEKIQLKNKQCIWQNKYNTTTLWMAFLEKNLKSHDLMKLTWPWSSKFLKFFFLFVLVWNTSNEHTITFMTHHFMIHCQQNTWPHCVTLRFEAVSIHNTQVILVTSSSVWDERSGNDTKSSLGISSIFSSSWKLQKSPWNQNTLEPDGIHSFLHNLFIKPICTELEFFRNSHHLKMSGKISLAPLNAQPQFPNLFQPFRICSAYLLIVFIMK